MLRLEQEMLVARIEVGTDDRKARYRDALRIVRHEAQKLGVGACRPRQHPALCLHARRECSCRIPDLLVGNEAGDQDLACLRRIEVFEPRIVEVVRILDSCRLFWHKGCRFDIQKRRGDKDEVACDIEVEVAHAIDLFEVLVCDLRDGDGADCDLLPRDKLEKEVERSRIPLRLDTERHALTPPEAGCRACPP